jgi:hypothetical protein
MLSRAPVTQESPAARFRSELGALLLLAIPVVLSELGWSAMSIVDAYAVVGLGGSWPFQVFWRLSADTTRLPLGPTPVCSWVIT